MANFPLAVTYALGLAGIALGGRSIGGAIKVVTIRTTQGTLIPKISDLDPPSCSFLNKDIPIQEELGRVRKFRKNTVGLRNPP